MDIKTMPGLSKFCYLIDTAYNEYYHTGKSICGLEYIRTEKGCEVRDDRVDGMPTLLEIVVDIIDTYGSMLGEDIDAIIEKDTPYRATPVGEKISMNLVFYREEDMIYNPENKEGNTSRSSSE